MNKYQQSKIHLILFLLVTQFISNSDAIGTQAAICYGGCASTVIACYSSQGYKFGDFTSSSIIPNTLNNCNIVFSACMARCSMDIT